MSSLVVQSLVQLDVYYQKIESIGPPVDIGHCLRNSTVAEK